MVACCGQTSFDVSCVTTESKRDATAHTGSMDIAYSVPSVTTSEDMGKLETAEDLAK